MGRSKLMAKEELEKWIEETELPLIMEAIKLSENIVVLKRLTKPKETE